jgi:small basic protein
MAQQAINKSHRLMNIHVFQQTRDILVDLLDKGKWAIITIPLFTFFQTYIFNDFDYLMWLAVLVSLDTVLGFGLAIFKREVEKEKFGDILIKMIVYSSCLIVGHVLENFTVSGQTMSGGEYLKFIIYIAILIKEAISVLTNAGKVSKKLVPVFILKRLKGFNETGDLTHLTQNFTSQDGEKSVQHINSDQEPGL